MIGTSRSADVRTLVTAHCGTGSYSAVALSTAAHMRGFAAHASATRLISTLDGSRWRRSAIRSLNADGAIRGGAATGTSTSNSWPALRPWGIVTFRLNSSSMSPCMPAGTVTAIFRMLILCVDAMLCVETNKNVSKYSFKIKIFWKS